jgi:RecB family exonuclease
MARKPTLSPSKITTYLACPVKYKWTYKDEKGKWYLRSRSYYSFGTTLHKVLQRFHDSGDQGVTTVHQAVAELEESWIDAGYQSVQEMQEALSEGKAIIQEYIEQQIAAPQTAQTIFIEKQFRADMGAYDLIGRMDRVDEHEDGSLEVIDYKSGRRGVTPEDVAADLAMACYQLLLKFAYPDREVSASIIALRAGQKATAAMTEQELQQFKSDLKALGEEILNRDYEGIEPTGKSLCHTCDFLPLCKKHPEFELPALEI